MGTQKRREREKENLRRAILDAARELFVKEDYKGVSMRRIAEIIEYSPTAIYLHFKDKEDILFHLVKEGFDLLAERMRRCESLPPERLAQLGRSYLQFAIEQPNYYKLMFEMELPLKDDACAPPDRVGEDFFGAFVRCISEGEALGYFTLNESLNGV